jgi:hypothetical protein
VLPFLLAVTVWSGLVVQVKYCWFAGPDQQHNKAETVLRFMATVWFLVSKCPWFLVSKCPWFRRAARFDPFFTIKFDAIFLFRKE